MSRSECPNCGSRHATWWRSVAGGIRCTRCGHHIRLNHPAVESIAMQIHKASNPEIAAQVNRIIPHAGMKIR